MPTAEQSLYGMEHPYWLDEDERMYQQYMDAMKDWDFRQEMIDLESEWD